jgi:hypothetical protein
MWSQMKEKKERLSANPNHLLSYPRYIMKILLIYAMKLYHEPNDGNGCVYTANGMGE